MRLWHQQLVSVLPREQLVAQWRECSAIAGNIQTKGSPNHLLVNKIMDYPMNHFITYAAYIRQEMTNRNYHTMDKVWNKITAITNNDYNILPINEIYPNWMNNTYLQICYWNLYEKYICGGIKEIDWIKIEEKVKFLIDSKQLNNGWSKERIELLNKEKIDFYKIQIGLLKSQLNKTIINTPIGQFQATLNK